MIRLIFLALLVLVVVYAVAQFFAWLGDLQAMGSVQ